MANSSFTAVQCPVLPAPPSALEQGTATLVQMGPTFGPCHGRTTLEGHTVPSMPGFTVRVDEDSLTSDGKVVARVRISFRNIDRKNIKTLVTLSQKISVDDIAVRTCTDSSHFAQLELCSYPVSLPMGLKPMQEEMINSSWLTLSTWSRTTTRATSSSPPTSTTAGTTSASSTSRRLTTQLIPHTC